MIRLIFLGRHPFILATICGMAGMIVYFFIQGIFEIGFLLMSDGSEYGMTPIHLGHVKSWTFVIASAIWISGWAAGMLGVLYFVKKLRTLKKYRKPVTDYSLLDDLSESETQKLGQWIQKEDCSFETVQRLWQ